MHFYVFCGFGKLKVLNLQSFYHLQNLHLHFSAVLVETCWYTAVCKYSGCTGLTEVYCYATEIPTTGSSVFGDVPTSSATLHVPAVSLEAYKTTSPWSGFGNIVPLTDEETGIETIHNLQFTIHNEGVYDLSGRKLSQMQKGINIVKMSDGSTCKVLIR